MEFIITSALPLKEVSDAFVCAVVGPAGQIIKISKPVQCKDALARWTAE